MSAQVQTIRGIVWDQVPGQGQIPRLTPPRRVENGHAVHKEMDYLKDRCEEIIKSEILFNNHPESKHYFDIRIYPWDSVFLDTIDDFGNQIVSYGLGMRIENVWANAARNIRIRPS